MTARIGEVYDAFLEAGASPEKARKASEALAGYENRFSKIERQLAELKGETNLIKWMLGFNVAITVGVLLRLLTV